MPSMRAGRLHVKPPSISVDDVPIPEPGPGEVLVRVRAAGVCLSDVHLVQGVVRPRFLEGNDVTLGHEVAGEVAKLGEGVTRCAVGDRVLLHAGDHARDGRVLTRGVDYDGGFAEYALATQETVIKVPDTIPFEQAAIIPDAVSTPWGAIKKTGKVVAGESVAVWGLGGLGTHAVQLLRMIGAAPIVAIDPLPAARERALKLGADVACSPDEAFDVVPQWAPDGLNVAFDFAGVQPVREQALKLLGKGGRLVIVGLAGKHLDAGYDTEIAFKGLQILGNYGSDPEHVEELVKFVAMGRLDLSTSISGTFPLEQAPQIIEKLENKEGNPIRFILQP